MIKKILKTGKFFIITVMIASVFFLCLAWIFQAGILKFFALRMLAPFSDKVSVEDLSGNLVSGFLINNGHFSRKNIQISIPSAKIRPEWRFLFKEMSFLEITVEKPAITLMSSGKDSRSRGGVNTLLLLNLPIKNANISGAAIEYIDRSGRIYVFKNTGLEASLKNRVVKIKNLKTGYEGVDLSAKGVCSKTGCDLSGKASASGERAKGREGEKAGSREGGGDAMTAVFSANLSGSEINISGNAHAYGGTADFSCKLLTGDKWNLELKFAGMKPAKILKKLEPLGVLTGRLVLEGAGFSSLTAKGKGIFRGETSEGLKIKSGIRMSGGSILSDADFSGKQILLKVKSSYKIKERSLSAEIFSSGELAAEGEILRGLTISSYVFTADVSAKPAEMELKFNAEVTGIEMKGMRVEKFMVAVRGKPESHSVQAEVQTYGRNYELKGTGIFAKNGWTAEFAELTETLDGGAAGGGVNLQQPFTLTVSAAGTEISGFAISREDESYQGNLKYHEGKISGLSFIAKNMDVSPLNRFILPDLDLQGRVDAAIKFDGTDSLARQTNGGSASGGKNGQMAFSAKELYIREILVGKIKAVLDFSPQSLASREILIETPGGALKAGIDMSFANPWRELKDYNMTIVSSNTDISFLRSLAPYLAMEHVFLNSNIKIISGKNGFSMKGGANISCPKISLQTLGLGFDNVNINLESAHDSIKISGNGGGRKTCLNIKGEMNTTGPKIELTASETTFEIPEWLSGTAEKMDILFRGTWRSPEFTGAVKLSRLEFFQEKYDETLNKEKISDPGDYALDITASAQRNAWYRAETGSIEAMGQVILKKNPNEPVRLLGEVESIRGYYSYFGRNFDVRTAKISFTGQIPEDPKIYLLASYDDKPNSVVINFEADGTAKYLKSRLSSEPAMEQRDIISLLVTGQPLYKLYEKKETVESQEDRSSANLAAQQMLTGYLSAKAGGKVMKALDLDVLSMKLTQERKPDITVGRYLTPDLFISYGQTLGPKGEKRINAEYSLSKHFSLEGKNSSEGRYSADFLFKFGFR